MEYHISIDTKNLREKLYKVSQTGLVAWEAGQIAYRVRETKSYAGMRAKTPQLFEYYTNFEQYTQGELGKSESTINIYINIYLAYKDGPEPVQDLLVGHLKQLIKLANKENRDIVTSILNGLGNENEDNDIEKKIVPALLSTIKKDREQYSAEDVMWVVNILLGCEKLSREQILSVFDEAKAQKQAEKENTRKKKMKRDEFGVSLKPLKSCNKLSNYLEKEPCDECGFVAVFCLIFDCLKEITFDLKLEGEQTKVKFEKIKFIREAFPDACVTVTTNKQETKCTEIYIEFEYETRNYFKHGHHEADKKCDMIVVWRNNLNVAAYPIDRLKSLPPIFCVEDFLYKGATNLFNAYFLKYAQKVKMELHAASEKLKKFG